MARILIGELELLIDAPFNRAEVLLPTLLEQISSRLTDLTIEYGIDFEQISVEHHCIRARYLAFAIILNNLVSNIPSFIRDYPAYKHGIEEIITDLRTSTTYVKDALLRFNKTLYGPVKSGESLTLILRRLNIPEEEWKKLIPLIVKENPDAFIDGEPNRLKTGAILRIPPFPNRESLPYMHFPVER